MVHGKFPGISATQTVEEALARPTPEPRPTRAGSLFLPNNLLSVGRSLLYKLACVSQNFVGDSEFCVEEEFDNKFPCLIPAFPPVPLLKKEGPKGYNKRFVGTFRFYSPYTLE